MNPTPAEALENLTRIAEQALLNGPQRRAIDASIATLHALVQKATPASPEPQGPSKKNRP